MTTIDDVLEYWTINNLDQSNTLLLLIDAFESIGIVSNADDLEELLLRIAVGNRYVTEDEARIIINIFERDVKDIPLLKKIACILAGENLENDYTVLETIMFKHHWSVSEDTNIFICWYYRLSNNKDYYEWVLRSFWHSKFLILCKTLLLFLSILSLTRGIMSSIIYLFSMYGPGVYDLYLAIITTFTLFISLFLMMIATYKYNLFVLFQLDIKFKKYIV